MQLVPLFYNQYFSINTLIFSLHSQNNKKTCKIRFLLTLNIRLFFIFVKKIDGNKFVYICNKQIHSPAKLKIYSQSIKLKKGICFIFLPNQSLSSLDKMKHSGIKNLYNVICNHHSFYQFSVFFCWHNKNLHVIFSISHTKSALRYRPKKPFPILWRRLRRCWSS